MYNYGDYIVNILRFVNSEVYKPRLKTNIEFGQKEGFTVQLFKEINIKNVKYITFSTKVAY